MNRAGHVRISGYVLSHPHSKPVSGAKIIVPAMQRQTRTRRDGHYAIWVMQGGNVQYIVIAEAGGYRRSEMYIPARADITVDFMLSREGVG